MQPLALKNLWSITGKHGAATNAIYGTTGNPLSPYLTDDSEPPYCLFVIGNRVGAKKAYLFDNEIRNGVQLWETVADRIKEHRETGVLYTNCTHLEIAVIVFSAYYDVTVEDAMALNVRMVNKLPCWDLNGVRVYDLRKNNLVSDTVRSPTFSNAFIVRKHCDMAVICKGVAFWTEYDKNLYSALQKIRDWTLNRGRAAEQKKGSIIFLVGLQ